MLEIRDKNASTLEVRKRDISSWQEASITSLNSKAKKRFSKNKSAIIAYFTGDKSVEEIATQYNLSTEQLLKMAENCLKQHEDGSPWGYRALLPGILVKDHSPNSAPEQIEAQNTTTDNAPSTQEPAKQEQVVDNQGDLESTAKRLAITTTSADAPEEVLVEVVPTQSGDSDNLESTDQRQNQESEVSSPSVSEDPEVVSAKVAAEDGEIEILDQLDKTQPLSAKTSTSLADTVISAPDASSPSDDMDTQTLASEPELTPATEDPIAEAEVIPDSIEAPDADVNTTTLPSPTPAEPILAEATEIEEHDKGAEDVSETEDTPTPVATQEPTVPPAEPEQTAWEEASEVKNETTAVALIDNTQALSLQDASARMPFLPEPTVSSPIAIHLLPNYVKYSKRTTTAHMAQRRRFVRKRWLRDSQDKTKRHRMYRTVSIALVAVILLSLLLPLGVGLAAYNVYNNVSGLAHDGINHLMTVKDLLPTSKNDITSVLDAKKLQQAQGQLKAAETDFVQLQQLANRPDIQSIVQQVAPQYAGKLTMAKHLLQVALDVSRMGEELSGVGVIAAGIVHSSPLASNSAKPLISTADVSDIKAAITHALYYMDDIQQNMSQVQMKDLPVSVKQQEQLSAVLTQLPAMRNMIVQNQNMVDLVTWLLGVGQPRRFLIQTMDTGELRPGGGFTGQYGVLSVQNGRVSPFSLRDVALLDYAGNGTELGRQAPSQYSWMNFGNWGLRDSNLSGDYPTTARINAQVFQEEGGGPVQGVIDFTPAFIGHIIDQTGPIHVAEYNETITSANLEDKLHYYQQDYNAIAVEQLKSHDTSHQARKQFTSLLGKLLLDRVSHLPTAKLIALIKNAAKDIQSRDLEIYFTNPAAEQWLVTNGYSGGTSTFTRQDGFMVVQANISISKASKYVHTTEQDNITLDAQGGATHNLSITLNYNRADNDVYGFTTYSDYMRVYMPGSSQYISGDGFDTGHPLCTAAPPSNKKGTTTGTPASSCGLPPSETLYCPSGNYSLGQRASNMPQTADVMGAPTATRSDLPGRGMFGGMTVTPSDCISTIMLSWYVPNAVRHNGKNMVYPLLVQKQGGMTPTVEINVDASAIKGMKSFSFKGDLHADRLFNIH